MKIKLQIFIAVLGMGMVISCSGKKTVEKNNHTTPKDSIIVKENPRSASDFEKFLKYFMTTAVYGKNFDSLLANSDSIVTQFMHKEIGFGRYWNQGAFCNLYTDKTEQYGYVENAFRDKLTQTGLPLFAKAPVEGFCEESKSADGIYYVPVKEFPDTWDMEEDKAVKVKLPEQYASSNKMKVMILSEKWIVNQFYFVQVDNIWYLTYTNDCDCSV